MRHAAEIRPAYERNFYACQKFDRAACEAALAYPYLNDADRNNLLGWKQVADQRHAALDVFEQNRRNCRAGSISACDAAINDSHLDESARSDLQTWRTRLRLADQERRAAEQQRQAALAEFRSNQRSCYGGSIAACTAAISDRHLDEVAARLLEGQRDRLQRAEQRQAEMAAYRQLRADCAAGQRAACKAALGHAQTQPSDRALLERRDRELAPLSERVANLFAASDPGGSTSAASTSSFGVVMFGVMVLFGVGAGTVFVMRRRGAATLSPRDPPNLGREPSAQASKDEASETFVLTGHMPTDVRRAIREATL